MKKNLLFLLFTFFLATNISFGQATIFTYDFEDSGNDGQWSLNTDVVGTGVSHWVLNNSYSGGGFPTIPNQPGTVTGGPNSRYLHIKQSTNPFGATHANYGGQAVVTHTVLANNVSTVGYNAVGVKFQYLCNGVSTIDFGRVEYSTDGGTVWNALGSDLTGATSWTLFDQTNAAMNNISTLKIRFKWTQNASGFSQPPFCVDQIEIYGTSLANITTGTLSPAGPYCAGASVSVPYTITGTYTAGNTFTAQMSDGTGLFGSPTSIGTLSSTSAGTINAVIPAGTSTASGYRIRVIASTPSVTGSQTSAFTVTALPNTIGSATSYSICTGATATLNAINATSYSWMPGGMSGASVTHIPSTTTTYTVTGTANGCSKSDTVLVTVTPLTINASASPTSLCAGSGVSSTISANNATSYTWAPGGMTGAVNSVMPSTTTTYTISGTLGACSAVTNVTVTVVNAIPVAVANPTNICAGTSSTITATGGFASVSWTPGGSSSNPLVVSPSLTTTYTVIGTNGTCTGMDTVTVSVGSLIVIASTSTDTVCSGSSATLSATGATTYSWEPGLLIGASVSVNPTSTTTYTVTGLSGTCDGLDVITITSLDLPVVTMSPITPDTICHNGTAITLTGGSPTGGVYSGTTVNSGVFTPSDLSPGNNVITYTYTDGNNCSNTATTSIFVEICNSIAELNGTRSVNAFPNPSHGIVTLNFNNLPTGNKYFEVLNILGQVIQTQSIQSNTEKIELPQGIYFIRNSFDPNNAIKVVVQ